MEVKEMNTEEAIEIIEGIKDGNVPSSYSEFCKEYNHKLNKVIECLEQGEKYRKELITIKKREIISELFVDEQGEKYRQMIDRIRDNYRYNSFIIHSGRAILEYLEKLEEAYFPKEAKCGSYFYECTSEEIYHLKKIPLKEAKK